MELNYATGGVLLLKMLLAALVGGGAAAVVVGLWLERILAGWEAAALFVGCAVFAGLTIIRANSPAYFFMLMMVGGIAIGSWLASRAAERGLRNRFLDEDERKSRGALDFDYKNVAAHSLLGDVYAQRRRWEKAIEEYEISLQLDPSQTEERFKLEHAVRQLSIAEGRSRECPACGAEWPKDSETCPECGRSAHRVVELRKWVAQGGTGTVGWGALALVAIGVLLLSVGLMTAAFVVLAAALWVGSLALLGWRYLRPKR